MGGDVKSHSDRWAACMEASTDDWKPAVKDGDEVSIIKQACHFGVPRVT